MRKLISYFGAALLFLCFTVLPVQPVSAQNFLSYTAPDQKPVPTSPEYVAMIFSKLSGEQPDFASWARNTEAYQNASRFDQPMVQEREAEKLKNIFSLLAWQDPLTIETPVKLSAYSAANKGFLIDNFTEKTFLPVRYSGQSYAVIAERLMDRQWVDVPDSAVAETMETAAAKNKEHMLIMSLTLIPKYADNGSQATLEGEKYWLLSAEIKKALIFDPASSAVLWRSTEDPAAEDPKLQELLKLRQ